MSSFFGGLAGGKQKTVIKPRKNLPEHTKQYQLKKYADATLGSGNLRSAVTLPEGEDLNEWLAVNTLDFYNQINMLYGTVTEFCTPTECPVMNAGSRSVPLSDPIWSLSPNSRQLIINFFFPL
ncbi:Mitotic exit network component [Puccinia graminis f. sp. tritici]|uniref:Mitotic exit network component n=1 Tax=Puccinia graminis f. sp. tritici TaxID=56615 RepID=A0A5B0RHM3_PUCGR|nr:Mitotic exit network component [Puccinia graminis f. sp. tritici]